MKRRQMFKLGLGAAALMMAGISLAADTIKVGTIISVTGPASALGEPQLKTLEIYIDKINKEGGILGKKVEWINYDDASDSLKANSFAKRLVENDSVDLIIGGTTTGATMSMVPIVEKAGVPLISLSGAVVVVEPVKKWVFKTPHTDRMAAERVYEDMKKRGITNVALISDTGGFGQSGRKESQIAAKKFGINLVADETYGPKDTDVTSQLTKIRSTPGVQAIHVFGFGQGPIIVTKNIAQLGMKLPVYQSHGVANEEFKKFSGPAGEGVRLPSPAVLVADKLPAADPQRKVAMDYAREYRAAAKAEPSTFGGYAYDALFLAVDALKRAGTADKAKVRDAIEQASGFVGTGGVFNMTPNDHMGLSNSAFRLLEIKNGEWHIIN